MSFELLSLTIFWTWNAWQPAPPSQPTVQVPSKVILQANWVEPAALRDETRTATPRQFAAAKKRIASQKTPSPITAKKPQKPLWRAAPSWEIPPILWASFEGFVAAGLGIVSLLKR